MNTGLLLKKKINKVTMGANAANTVLEEYSEANVGPKRKRAGNERLKKDKAYLNTLSKYTASKKSSHI